MSPPLTFLLPSYQLHPDVLIGLDEWEADPHLARARSAGAALRLGFGPRILSGPVRGLRERLRSVVNDSAFEVLTTELTRAVLGITLGGGVLPTPSDEEFIGLVAAGDDLESQRLAKRLHGLVALAAQAVANAWPKGAADFARDVAEHLPGTAALLSMPGTPLEVVSPLVAGLRLTARLVGLAVANADTPRTVVRELLAGAIADLRENARLLTLDPDLPVPVALVPRDRRLDLETLERGRHERIRRLKSRVSEFETAFADD